VPAPRNANRTDLTGAGRPTQSPPQRPATPAGPGRNAAPQPPARGGLATIPAYIWLLGVCVVVLLLIVGAMWAVYTLRGQWAVSGPTPTPIIWTPTAQPAVPTQPPPTPEPATPMPTAPAGIEIGGYVQITGTEGAGLSLRDGPGTTYQRMDVGVEGEVFQVVDGPAAADEVAWWKLRDPDQEDRSWWAAANFLVPVAGP
jgi:hypothetical protein